MSGSGVATCVRASYRKALAKNLRARWVVRAAAGHNELARANADDGAVDAHDAVGDRLLALDGNVGAIPSGAAIVYWVPTRELVRRGYDAQTQDGTMRPIANPVVSAMVSRGGKKEAM